MVHQDSNSMSYPHNSVLGHKSTGLEPNILSSWCIRTLTQCLTHFVQLDINTSSYFFGAIKLKSIVLPTMKLNLKPSK